MDRRPLSVVAAIALGLGLAVAAWMAAGGAQPAEPVSEPTTAEPPSPRTPDEPAVTRPHTAPGSQAAATPNQPDDVSPPALDDELEHDEPDDERSDAVSDRSIWPVSREGIQGAMTESTPGIVECYEGWLSQNPELAGKIVVSFQIAPSDTGENLSKVQQVDLDASTVGHAFMEGCVLSVVEELRFEGGESTTVSYPFIFRQTGDDDE